jgi:hypothetical protein
MFELLPTDSDTSSVNGRRNRGELAGVATGGVAEVLFVANTRSFIT